MPDKKIIITESSDDYSLVDSGEGEKLERYGKFILSRPDPQAVWAKHEKAGWKNADGQFARSDKGSDWFLGKNIPEKWPIDIGGLKFWIKPTVFKHVGIFPEQSKNWEWLEYKIKDRVSAPGVRTAPDGTAGPGVEVLNLFGYTGGATLACAKAGAKVVHVDGSKVAIGWARENASLSGLEKKPVRWILDDARVFVRREIKRARKYDGIIMDPPSFGHGPEGELWKIEEHLLGLVEDCFKLLSDGPLFFLINGYSAGYSALAYENILTFLKEKFGGDLEAGELAIKEEKTVRLLPCGIFARWSK